MALIKCYECSKEISDKAISCPNCGAPTNLDSDKKNHQLNKGGFSIKILYGFLKKINPKTFFWAYPIMILIMHVVMYVDSPSHFYSDYNSVIFMSIAWLVILMVIHISFYFNPVLNLFSSKNIKNVIGSAIVLFAYDFSLGGEFGSYFGDGAYYPYAIRIIAMLIITIPITGIIMIFKKDRSNWSSMLMWTTIVCSILSLLNKYAL